MIEGISGEKVKGKAPLSEDFNPEKQGCILE